MPQEHESGCAMMKRVAKEQEEAIRRTRKRIDELEDKIASLSAQPHPDQQQIQALRQAVENLQAKVEEDERSLSDLQDVITENC